MDEAPQPPPVTSLAAMQTICDFYVAKTASFTSEVRALLRRFIDNGHGPLLKATFTSGDMPLPELLTMYAAEEGARAVVDEGEENTSSESEAESEVASERELSFEFDD